MPGESHVPSPMAQLLSKPSFGTQGCLSKAAFTGSGAPHGCASPPPDFTHPGGQERGASNNRQRRAQQHPDTSPAVLAPDSLPTFLDQLMLQLLP